jgi:hypothetical protein
MSKILSNRRSAPATFVNIDNGLYKLHDRYTYGAKPHCAAQYDQQSLLANELRAVCHLHSTRGYFSTASSYQQVVRDFVWSPYITYMNLNIKITTRNGNVINCLAH